MASVSSLIISSVSGVSGAARTMKSDSASSSGSVLRPADPIERDLAERHVARVRDRPAPRPPVRSPPRRRRRTAMTRQPKAVASAPTARPIDPSPTMPTVTSRSSAPSSGCHVRSRWSSRSCGSRRLTARIIIRTYSAIGPAEDAAGVGDDHARARGPPASGPAPRPRSPSGPTTGAGRGPAGGRRRPAAASRGA